MLSAKIRCCVNYFKGDSKRKILQVIYETNCSIHFVIITAEAVVQ